MKKIKKNVCLIHIPEGKKYYVPDWTKITLASAGDSISGLTPTKLVRKVVRNKNELVFNEGTKTHYAVKLDVAPWKHYYAYETQREAKDTVVRAMKLIIKKHRDRIKELTNVVSKVK